MKKISLWLLGVALCAFFWGPPPAYAPLVTVYDKESASEEKSGSDDESTSDDSSTSDTSVVDLSDVDTDQPTWSPSFENQEEEE